MQKKDMQKQNRPVCSRQNLTATLVAVLVAFGMLLFCLAPTFKSKSYNVVILGDSVIANFFNYYGSPSIPEYVERQTGLTVYNGAFGGSGMAVKRTEQSGAALTSSWCMANLAEDIGLDAWEGLRASMSYANHYVETNPQVFSNYEERLKGLSQIDFDKVDVLILEHGTNDYNMGVTVDNPSDPYDKTTFGGALRYSLKLLQEKYPNLQIVLLTPFYCEINIDGEYIKCDEKDWGGGILEDYVKKEMEIANEFGVDLIDGYYGSGINAKTLPTYMPDRLHPSADGVARIGDMISSYLKGNGYESQ